MTIETSFKQSDYEIVTREILYQGIFRMMRYSLCNRLFSGEWSEIFSREVLERYSAIAVLPYDPILDRVILIEQFRPGSLFDPHSPWLIEIPAGVIDRDEKPDAVALRESIEEADCEILALHPVCEYFVSPGATNEYIHIYCGKVDARHIQGIHGLKHEHEDIRVLNLSLEEALTLVYSGKIKTSHSLIALLWLQIHDRELQAAWA